MKHIITGVLLAGVILLVPNARSAEITGFVGYSSMQVAPNMTVKLIKGDSGQVADIDETNFFGKYTFEGVSPGYYKLQAGDVVRELMIKGKDDEKRIDIDLSAKGGAMDYSGTVGETNQQSKAEKGVTQREIIKIWPIRLLASGGGTLVQLNVDLVSVREECIGITQNPVIQAVAIAIRVRHGVLQVSRADMVPGTFRVIHKVVS